MDRIENDASNNSSIVACCRGNVLSEPLHSNDRAIHKRTDRLCFDATWTAQKTTRPIILPLLRVFVAAGTFFPNRCIATIGLYTDGPTDSALIRHRPHRKRRVQQFFCCCVYSLQRERVARQSNIEAQRLMWWIYEVCSWDGLRCYDIYKSHKDWFRHSEVNRRGFTNTYTHTDIMNIAHACFNFFFQNKENRLKMMPDWHPVAQHWYWVPEQLLFLLGSTSLFPKYH
jgi:hypothetical protein